MKGEKLVKKIKNKKQPYLWKNMLQYCLQIFSLCVNLNVLSKNRTSKTMSGYKL